MRAALIVVTLAVTAAACSRPAPADLVLHHGRVITVDDHVPDGTALAASGGKIVAVGSDAEIDRYIGASTHVIDLAGQLAIPGFIDGHAHFTAIGQEKMQLELQGARTWDDIVALVAAAVKTAKPGQWIEGRGWHQEKWAHVPEPNVEGFPTHASLDAVSPENPVVLTHASGHGVFVNAKALELSHITRDTPNPPGGEILRDAKGNPEGFLRESAQGLVKRPPVTDDEIRQQLARADQEVISKGITTLDDAGSEFHVIDLMKQAIDTGVLHVRLWVMARSSNESLAANLDRYRIVGYGGGKLTVRAIKTYMDGALGSRGAWLLKPYSDKPDSTGLNITPLDTIRQTAQIAIDHGFQLCIHAIGDRANREVLNIYQAAFEKNGKNGKDLRWRIEHAQHLDPADIPRFGQLGVIASMQTIHCTSDAPFVIARLGPERAEAGGYVWQKLMKSGAIVTDGTDAPVEDVDPIPNYYAAVTRRSANGQTFFPDQRMSRMEALRAYTILNAYAGFEEDVKGSLTPGKVADITVLTKDITTVPDDEIKTAKVSYTIIGGQVVYTRPPS